MGTKVWRRRAFWQAGSSCLWATTCLLTAACDYPWSQYDPRLSSAGGSGGGGSGTSTWTDTDTEVTTGGGGTTGTGDTTGSNADDCAPEKNPNLAVNAGFESGSAAWIFQTQSPGPSSSDIVSGAGVAGSNALRIFNAEAAQWGSQVYQAVIDGTTNKLAKGDTYLVSALLHGESGGENAAVVLQSSGGSTSECGTLIQAVGTSFSRFGCRLRVPEPWDQKELLVLLRSGGTMEAAYFDDVYFGETSPNGLYNGAFENDFVGWSYFETGPQNGTVSISMSLDDDGASCAGGRSVRIQHQGDGDAGCGLQQPSAPLNEGTSYKLTAWARGQAGGETFSIDVRDDAKPWVVIATTNATLTTDWTKITLQIGPVDALLADVVPRLTLVNRTPNGTVFVDGAAWDKL
jgi:hypothetical protein